MATKIVNAQVGQTVTISVRAVQNTANGIVYSDFASMQYTVPTTDTTGGNIGLTNISTDLQLNGGSLYAGTGFNTNVGLLNVSSGSTTGTGIVLNKTGFAGFNAGVKEFYIDASTGKAYFSGNITAGAIKIGKGVGLAGENGIFINQYNYWYEDGTWSAKGSDIAGALVGPKINKPCAVANLKGLWVGSAFNVTFDFTAGATGTNPDGTAYSNQYAQDFLISFYTSSADLTNNKTYAQVKAPIGKSTSQLYSYQPLFGITPPEFYAVSVAVEDSFGNSSTVVTITSASTGGVFVGKYQNNFVAPDQYPLNPSPTYDVVAGQQGYKVTYTPLVDLLYNGIVVQETSSLTAPVVWSTVYSGLNSPAVITTTDTNPRYVRSAYIDYFGGPGAYAAVRQRTPNSPVTLNVNAANEVASMSGSFSNGGVGNDVNISGFVYNVTGLSAVGISGSGTTITYTSTTPHGFKTGDQVQITGMSNSAFNLTGVIAIPATNPTTTFTLTGSATGTASAITTTATGSTQVANTNIITLQNPNTSITVGMLVTGAQVPTGTYVKSITNSTTVVVNNNLNLSSISLTFTAGIAQYAGITYVANLVYTSNGASKNGYFYLNPDGTGNTYQSFTIASSDIYSQFGAYYPNFTANFITVNSAGIRSTGYAISQFSRTVSSTLSSAPVPSITANVSGIIVGFDFSSTTATYAEVYRQYRPWTTAETSTTFPDAMTATYSSGGAIGSSTVVLTSFVDETGTNPVVPTNYIGYPITGSNVPANSWIGAVSGTDPYTIILANGVISNVVVSGTGTGTVITYTCPNSFNVGDKVNIINVVSTNSLFNLTNATIATASSTQFTINPGATVTDTYTSGGLACPVFTVAQTAGNTYTMNALVYQGSGPASIFSTYYVPQYFIVKYYDNYGNSTPPSSTGTLSYIPINPVTNLITSAIQVGGGGSIYVGNSATSGARVLVGANNTLSGVFAFDPVNTNPTTSIIASGTSGGYTFTTTNAHIADWNIKSTAIENDINAVAANQYTGLSGSAANGYSFWAGASSSGNSTGNANFSVTPAGTVLAKNMSIVGSSPLTNVTALGNGSLMTYTTPSNHNLVNGQQVTITNMSVAGYNVTNATITVPTTLGVPSANTFTIAGTATTAATGGAVSPVLISAGGLFSVTSGGVMTAASATITGNITAQTGLFIGNVGITSPGSLYSGSALTQTISSVSIPSANTARYVLSAAHTLTVNDTVYISGVAGATTGSYSGVYKVSAVNIVANSFDVTITGIAGAAVIQSTPPIAQIIKVTSGYILNSSGITFNNSTTKGITTIDASTGLFTTSSANIGGWQINPATNIGSLYSTSGTGTVLLDSTNTRMYVTNTLSAVGYTAGIALPKVAKTDPVFWAGSGGIASNTNPFYVTAEGFLYASNAQISGNITASNITATAVLTGNTIQTALNVGPTVAGVIFDSTGIKAYNGISPTPLISITSGGAGEFSGVIKGSTISGGSIYGATIATSSDPLARRTVLDPTTNALSFYSTGGLGQFHIVPLNDGAHPGVIMHAGSVAFSGTYADATLGATANPMIAMWGGDAVSGVMEFKIDATNNVSITNGGMQVIGAGMMPVIPAYGIASSVLRNIGTVSTTNVGDLSLIYGSSGQLLVVYTG